MAFHVGQRVVCVDDSEPRFFSLHRLRKGAIYVIRGFDTEATNDIGLYLEGLHDPVIDPWKYETGWGVHRFRPVIERKSQTDIGVFLEILDRETIRDPKVTPALTTTHTQTS